MILRRSIHLALALIAFLAVPLASAQADQRGTLSGRVTDQDGRAIPFASVGIPAAKTGGLTDSEGNFRVAGITPGSYQVKVNYIGYEQVLEDVVVEEGKTTQKNFKLKQIIVKREKEVVVTADRPLVEVRSSATVRSVTSEDIKRLAVTNLEQVLEQQTGTAKTNDEIHVRGGRSDEVSYIVDGAKTRDLVSGKGTAGKISSGSVAEVGVITGGFDAEFGQALSGVVQVRLKEGSARFHGSVEYRTDRVGSLVDSASSFNTDGASFQVDGPEPLTRLLGWNGESKLTFLASLNTEFSDTYLYNIHSGGNDFKLSPGYQDSFLGSLLRYGHFFSPRQDNGWQGLYKLAYKAATSDKFSVTYNKSLQIDQGFGRHLVSDIADDRNTYPYRWTRRLDHAAIDTEDNTTLSGTWTHVFGTSLVQQIQLARNVSVLHVGVQGKNGEETPWREYVAPNDDIWKVLGAGTADTLKAYDLFYDTGDDSIFQDRYSRETSLSYSLNKASRHHDLKAGTELNVQTAQFIDIENPWDQDPDTLGSKHDIFTVHPATGDFYVRDRIDYEGFVADVGLRWDLYFPGREAEAAVLDTSNLNITKTVREGFQNETFSLLGRRVKAHLSPRISVSHPITERDNFYFNYGEFTQWPAYYYIYSKIGSISSENFPQIGNVNLDPTVSIQFELGGRHQISDFVAANIAFYQKDTYGYPTLASSQRIQGASNAPFSIYLNSDFSRSRGIELELEKRRSKYFASKVTYEFSTIRSKSSSPNQLKIIQELGGDTREARVGDEVAYWHRPHQARWRLSWTTGDEVGKKAFLGLIDLPSRFSMSWNFSLRSGRAYTPGRVRLTYDSKDSSVSVSSEAIGASNSANAPAELNCDLKMARTFSILGRSLDLNLTATNLFNTGRNKFIDPTTGKAYQDGQGLWGYYEKTAIQKYRHSQITSNPSVLGPGRNIRMSVGYDW